MRRILAGSAALALLAAMLLPAPIAAARALTCDEEMIPGWTSLAYAPVPRGLAGGTHEFIVEYAFTDVDGSYVEGSFTGSFEVDGDLPLLAGRVEISPWSMRAPQPPHDAYWIGAMNPAQPAVFLLGWGYYQTDPITGLTLTRQQITTTMHGVVQTVSLDGGPAVPMQFHEVFEECYWLP